jgi:hypothetical protein
LSSSSPSWPLRRYIIIAKRTPAICIALNHISALLLLLLIRPKHKGSCACRVKASVYRSPRPNCYLLVGAAKRLPASVATVPDIISLCMPLLDRPTIPSTIFNGIA